MNQEQERLQEEEQERKAAAEKTALSVQASSTVPEDENDEVWESERQKRESELSRAIVQEWSRLGTVNETQLIKSLRRALAEWLSKRPPGFETRQAQKQELVQTQTRKAVDSWLRRKGD